ncbi:GGDEF domain-containing protein [Alteraurantiacibacter aestuarii]|uniref:diguanylate cyclase n=1 Tax=Alteraurantiacibacter aestuarii TaxID=650004 RepID=A0A844ZP28_9SPHN|nr:GGDEF domain-containing protein [Alteraurantiacibacter aestuarii]MXO88760.1 diguanylate cyclase [Alteraurantiacibacter aestuarii]
MLVDLALLADVITGANVWFGPVYLFVMCGATWLLGLTRGYAVAVCCMLLTFWINGFELYPYGSAALSWDLGLRFVALSMLIIVIAAVRGAFLREWWLARIEPLTGALNRQAFFEFAESLCSSRQWRLLIYADLDGLKAVNDRHGHAAGDKRLKDFSSLVRKSIRRGDVFARMGGDEFVIFMPVKSEDAARGLARRLDTTLNDRRTGPEGNFLCSLGALLVPPGSASLELLVGEADHLMYEAKVKGSCMQVGMAGVAVSPIRTGSARGGVRPLISAISTRQVTKHDRRAPHSP